VDGAERAVVTVDGDRLPYDDLVLALGARPMAGMPGALTFRGPADVERMRSALEELERQGGGRVIFTSRAVTSWTLPLYELALLTERWAREREVPLEVWIVTPEPSPLGVFGPEVSADVARLLSERGIVLRTGSVPEAADGGALTIPIEGSVPADLVVAMPVLVGSEIAGIPHDDMRFVPVDEFCRVAGLSGVYAVGDMTSHPIKQGGLATQQADVAAACIAGAAGAAVTPEPYRPVLRGLLLTGDTPRFLQSLDASDMPSPLDGESTLAPWWPADKIVATHLGNYLATHADLLETPAG
jgi:sulfide:quinone oxidoreductase